MQHKTFWPIVLILTGFAILLFNVLIHRAPVNPAALASAPAVERTGSPQEQILARLDSATAQPDRTESSDPAVRSIWAENDRKRYTALLSNQACAVLVVPMQTLHFGFDRATRSLLTAQLAHAIAADASRCVIDPYLAARALGDGMRQYSEQAVLDLARLTHASTIVWLYAGHDAHMKMEAVVRVQQHPADGSQTPPAETRKAWNDVAFSDQHPPFDSWQTLLPEMLKLVGAADVAPAHAPADDTVPGIPASPELLASPSPAGALAVAQRFQLLAMLGPDAEFRSTERLFEKSWLAAADVPVSALSRRIRARALFHLNFRPASLALLEGDDSAESRMLRALLDGNLVEAKKDEADLVSPLEKFNAALELQDLGLSYRRVQEGDPMPAALREVAARAPAWDALIGARVRDADQWHTDDNLALKAMLDHLYPVAGTSIKDVVLASATLGRAADEIAPGLLATRHVNALLSRKGSEYCCASFSVQPGTLDFLELVAVRAQANLEKQIFKLVATQEQPERALELLDAYDAEFSGHPHFSILRARSNGLLIVKGSEERAGQRGQAIDIAVRSTAYWEQGLTGYSAQAFFAQQQRTPQTPTSALGYDADFPPRSYWQYPAMLQDPALLARLLDYDVSDLAVPTLAASLARSPAQRSALLDLLQHRFVGAAESEKLRAQLGSTESGNPTPSVAQLRAAIANDPHTFALYLELAKLLTDESRFDEAADAVAGYPGFQASSGENSVTLSNDAGEPGSMLFWLGAIGPATRLYTIAAHYQNGSNYSLVAQQRLNVLAGDFGGYAELAIARAQRYDHASAYREYLSMLFAMGYSQQSWPAFLKIAGRFSNPEVWHAALVGQRVDGRSDAEVRSWLQSEPIRSIAVGPDRPAVRYALTHFMVDRSVPADLGKFVASVEATPDNVVAADGAGVARPGVADFRIAPASDFRKSEHARPAPGTPVVSPYALFAEAYAAQRNNDDTTAVAAFDRLAAFYRIDSPSPFATPMIFALPYFAMSAARTGDTLGLRAFLDRIPADLQLFDFHLAEAVFEGYARNAEKAREHLRLAFVRRPNTLDRAQLSPYQYAEACIWLFEQTADTQYRDLALEWARNYQRIDPAMAWAYALEARYTQGKGPARIRAIGIAAYLDRNSAWLSGVSAADLGAGKAWLKGNNPFAKKPAPGPAI